MCAETQCRAAAHKDCSCAQFNSPVEVNWNYMDGELLHRFWASHEEERAGAASIADRVLVFHRGISTVRALLLLSTALPFWLL